MNNVRLPRSFLVLEAVLVGVAVMLALMIPGLDLEGALVQIFFFGVLTWMILVIADLAIQQSNPNLFNGLVLGSVFGKLVLCLAFLFVYVRIWLPEGRSFLLVFFLAYGANTAYEVLWLLRLIRKNGSSKGSAVH